MAMLKVVFVDAPETPEELEAFQWAEYEDGPSDLFHPVAAEVTTRLRMRALKTLNIHAHRLGGTYRGEIAFTRSPLNSETTRYFVVAKLVEIEPAAALVDSSPRGEVLPFSSN